MIDGPAVFMGTPRAAVPILEALHRVMEVTAVVTRADKPRGRSKRLVAPPIKERALELGLAVHQPTSGADLATVVEAAAAKVAVVAAYGRLIKPDVLAMPRHGFVNVHYSLLPRWRGASPVVRAILAGDEVTGVSLMQMDAGLDTGPVIATREWPIGVSDTAGTLTDALAVAGGTLLEEQLAPYLKGEVVPAPQDDALATAAAKVTTSEAHIDPQRHSTIAIDRAVRAFNPRPGAWCTLDAERFKLWRVEPAAGSRSGTPGGVEERDDRIVMTTVDGAVELHEVQPIGKPRMAAADWMNGRRGAPAELKG